MSLTNLVFNFCQIVHTVSGRGHISEDEEQGYLSSNSDGGNEARQFAHLHLEKFIFVTNTTPIPSDNGYKAMTVA